MKTDQLACPSFFVVVVFAVVVLGLVFFICFVFWGFSVSVKIKIKKREE